MTEALLRSIRRWLITIALLLAVLLRYQTTGSTAPESVDPIVNAVATAVAFVAALWLWHSFRGATGADTAGEEASSTAEN
ncbi:hypothetical protein [Haloarchaeobius iranensis]|uniref:Uncharacterized protein n=1 Tax=Haloarchaeobius iranensis TaxID=996166 RepID=A0A1G9TRV1_9EURY|nr:hypothetical protein [Haloarchaeobius iranensis]SDM50489.1 hypothetical protein SAMN05192554_10397 [Haloarchaeobius iranensis]